MRCHIILKFNDNKYLVNKLTTQFKNLQIIPGGFPNTWTAGKLQSTIINKIGPAYANLYPDKQVQVISPNWDIMKMVEYLKMAKIDVLVVCIFSDPIWLDPLKEVMPIIEVGYTFSGEPIDFWAIVTAKHFKTYSEEELLPTDFKYLFLNYNRKPHKHRIALVEALEQRGLAELGLITLGDSKYNLNENVYDYDEHGATDIFGEIEGIPNDVYSLGRLDIWQQSFINIVGETVSPDGKVFLSEKIYKPIIGLRPFIINGSVENYKWLQDAEFDCFEDLFPVRRLQLNPHKATQIIAETIKQYQNVNIKELYAHILPRLKRNRQRFFEYTSNFERYLADE